MTFTIESVHGLKQTLTLETFTVGPQPKASSTTKSANKQASEAIAKAKPTAESRR